MENSDGKKDKDGCRKSGNEQKRQGTRCISWEESTG
jgi:hypothetical protein